MSEASPKPGRTLDGVVVDEKAPIRSCSVCGKPLWFGRTKAGKRCPFDVVDGERTTITHFSTCARVRAFERGRGA